MILCLSVDAIPTLAHTAENLFQASQLGLHLAEWETVPRVRSIQVCHIVKFSRNGTDSAQTIILFCQYLQLNSQSGGMPSQRDVWLAGAIRIAVCLGLNRLSDDRQKSVPSSPRIVSILLTLIQNASRGSSVPSQQEFDEARVGKTIMGSSRLHRLDVGARRRRTLSSHSATRL